MPATWAVGRPGAGRLQCLPGGGCTPFPRAVVRRTSPLPPAHRIIIRPRVICRAAEAMRDKNTGGEVDMAGEDGVEEGMDPDTFASLHARISAALAAAEAAEAAADDAEAAVDDAFSAAYDVVNALRTEVKWSPPDGSARSEPASTLTLVAASLGAALAVSGIASFLYLSSTSTPGAVEVLPEPLPAPPAVAPGPARVTSVKNEEKFGPPATAPAPAPDAPPFDNSALLAVAAAAAGLAIVAGSPRAGDMRDALSGEDNIPEGDPGSIIVDDEGEIRYRGMYYLEMDIMDPSDVVEDVGRDLAWSTGAASVPHPAKLAKGGEDAFFIDAKARMLGVADGVSGWADQGFDPALYARALCENGGKAAKRGTGQSPAEALTWAYDETEVEGSATACFAKLDGQRLLAANLGDSGFRVLRNGKVVLSSLVQAHQFNMPFQLSWVEFNRSNFPEEADEYDITMQPGDVVIVGSDGLFDNVYDGDIEAVVRQSARKSRSDDAARDLAEALAVLASQRSLDKEFLSPFVADAIAAGYDPTLTGGKVDDITVLAALVGDASGDSSAPAPMMMMGEDGEEEEEEEDVYALIDREDLEAAATVEAAAMLEAAAVAEEAAYERALAELDEAEAAGEDEEEEEEAVAKSEAAEPEEEGLEEEEEVVAAHVDEAELEEADEVEEVEEEGEGEEVVAALVDGAELEEAAEVEEEVEEAVAAVAEEAVESEEEVAVTEAEEEEVVVEAKADGAGEEEEIVEAEEEGEDAEE